MSPFFAPNHTTASFEALVAPLFATLRGLFGEASPFASSITTRHYDAFWPAFRAAFVEGPVGSYVMPANRLFPRTSWEDPERFKRIWAVLRAHLEQGRNIVGYHQAPRNRAGVDNAVGPAWVCDVYLFMCGLFLLPICVVYFCSWSSYVSTYLPIYLPTYLLKETCIAAN